jgi:hypothetical protein
VPYFDFTGAFSSFEINTQATEAVQFANNTKKMKTFIERLELKYEKLEKHFDHDLKINASMNQFLYEYEVNSIIAYSQEKSETK